MKSTLLTLAAGAFVATKASNDVEPYYVGIHRHHDPIEVLNRHLPPRNLRDNNGKIEKIHHWEHPEHDGLHHVRVLLNEETARMLKAKDEIENMDNANSIFWIPEKSKEGEVDPFGVKAEYPKYDPDATESASSLSWGLDRIDQESSELDKSFEVDYTGKGIRIYVLDTGTRGDHEDFIENSQSRVETGMNFAWDSDGYKEFGGTGTNGNVDCNGHGTHVGSIAAGKEWGVAKEATIVPVRVMDCNGSGSLQFLIDGIEWVIEDAKKHKDKKSILSMSLLAGYRKSLNDAVKKAVISGVAASIAAGNYNRNACMYSPGSEEYALTVGSTDVRDYRSSFSNWGGCVDVFAPGSSIKAADNRNTYGVRTMSGTSMACPYASGVLALVWEKNPKLDALEVIDYVINSSIKEKVFNPCEGSYNGLIQVPTEASPNHPDSFEDEEKPKPQPWSYTADGQTLGGKFKDWPIEFAIDDDDFEDDGFCLVFNAEVKQGHYSEAGVNIALSSNLPFGSTIDLKSYEGSCALPYAEWFFIFANHESNTKLYKLDEEKDSGSALSMSDGKSSYWVRAVDSDKGVAVDFGVGPEPGKNVIVSYKDESGSPNSIKRLSFGAPGKTTMSYTDIVPCDDADPKNYPVGDVPAGDGDDGDDEEPTEAPADDGDDEDEPNPTKEPAKEPSGDESQLFSRKGSGGFSVFKKSWQTDRVGKGCFKFNVLAKESIFILLSDSDETQEFGSTTGYELEIGASKGKFITLLRDGDLVAKLPFDKKLLSSSVQKEVHVELFDDGTLQVVFDNVLALDYKDNDPLDVKYLSLSSGKKKDVLYLKIRECSDEKNRARTKAPVTCGNFKKKKDCQKAGCVYSKKEKVCADS